MKVMMATSFAMVSCQFLTQIQKAVMHMFSNISLHVICYLFSSTESSTVNFRIIILTYDQGDFLFCGMLFIQHTRYEVPL